jgi:hypothetical protein
VSPKPSATARAEHPRPPQRPALQQRTDDRQHSEKLRLRQPPRVRVRVTESRRHEQCEVGRHRRRDPQRQSAHLKREQVALVPVVVENRRQEAGDRFGGNSHHR